MMVQNAKTCRECGEFKDFSCFWRNQKGKFGLEAKCVDCLKEQREAKRIADPERYRKYYREYYADNEKRCRAKARRSIAKHREEHKERSVKWRMENPEKARLQRKKWLSENPEKNREKSRRRRVRERSQLGYFPQNYEILLFDLQNGLCYYCGANLLFAGQHVEHKVPLSRKGMHDWSNVCLSCPQCNWSKGTKTATEFFGSLRKVYREGNLNG